MTPEPVADDRARVIAEALHEQHVREFDWMKGDRWSNPMGTAECGNCQRWGRYAVAAALSDTAAPEACPRCGSALQVDTCGIATCTEESCGEEWWPARAPVPADTTLTEDERTSVDWLRRELDDDGTDGTFVDDQHIEVVLDALDRILAQRAASGADSDSSTVRGPEERSTTADPKIEAVRAALDDPRWRDDVDADWLERIIRAALDGDAE